MRLNANQISTIKSTAQSVWGSQVQIILFGSRTHDTKRGGDIDLYLETDHPQLLSTIHCKTALEDQLELPVDLVVKPFGDQSSIAKIARSEGILL